MNTKVFLVSDGWYSDRCVRGIYSTAEKAELAKKVFSANNDVEEWTLDEIPGAPAPPVSILRDDE